MSNPEIKKTTGLLMSIIRTLSESSSNLEKRKSEKQRLEKAFLESDKQLNYLVQEHNNDITSIIQAFKIISNKVSHAHDRIQEIKDNLQSCKNLLHCKREELQRLWIEGIEYKTAVAMLDEIEEVKGVMDKLENYLNRKQYLHSTELLVKSVTLLDGDLSHIEALKDVKVELVLKREEIFDLLMTELYRQIYIKATREVEKGFQREGSTRQSKKNETKTFLKVALLNSTQNQDQETAAEKHLKLLSGVDLEEIKKPQEIIEDLHMSCEDDSVQFIAVLVESLAVLRKIPEAIDSLRSNIQPGLMQIISRASQQVADIAYVEGEEMSQQVQPSYLLELLTLLFKQFQVVARVHQIVLANMERIKRSMSFALGDFCLYEISEVWLKIQDVLRLFIGDYLDIRNSADDQSQTLVNFYEPTKDIGAYFGKKRHQKAKMVLFRFDASSHAISMNSYLREQRQDLYGSSELLGRTDAESGGRPVFVCKPQANNITAIYIPLRKFIKETESATRATHGSSTIQTFLHEFVKDNFLPQVVEKIEDSIEEVTEGYDARRLVVDLRTQREYNVPKPLLQFTVTIARNIEYLQSLMRDLPDYADQFLNMVCKMLQDYRRQAGDTYKAMVNIDSGEKKLISATWAKDEDICRLIKSLPNWTSLKDDSADPFVEMTGPMGMHRGRGVFGLNYGAPGDDDDDDEANEERSVLNSDLKALTLKESNVLTQNLSSEITDREIITDLERLRTLGNLCESLEWFSDSIERFADELGTTDVDTSFLKESSFSVSEHTLSTLRSLAQDFQELSESTLLVLHLEVRVHCFYYLLPLAGKDKANYHCAIDDMDPDVQVMRLNKELESMADIMRQSLQSKKHRYIFDGLGHLVSTILINHAQNIKKMNENGIKKMCRNVSALQQCLSNITMTREADLDHARQFYEHLYQKPAELLKLIRERGKKFSEQEYNNLVRLAHRSQKGAKDDDLERLLRLLTEILREGPS